MLAYVSILPSKSPGPTKSHISHEDGEIVVIEHFDPGANKATDEEQFVGTVGFHSTSPSYFCMAAEYIPYPVIERVFKYRGPPQPTTLDGRLVRIHAVLLRVPVKELRLD